MAVNQSSGRLLRVLREVDKRVNAAMEVAAEVLATEARRRVQNSPRGGITYVKYNPNRTHVASRAGDAPATDTGNLVHSITAEVDKVGKRFFLISSHSIAPYARTLEYGDMSGKIKPRPFMRPSLIAKQDKITEIIHKAVIKAIRDTV